MKKFKYSLGITAALVASVMAPCSQAQTWPTRPVQMIVPQAAGGTADILARELAAKLQARIGQPVVVDNKPGAGGVIGTDFVARAKPDGYTFMMGAISTHGINPGLYKNLAFNAQKDFVPVAMVATAPLVLVTSPSVRADSVEALLAQAHAEPGKLTYGSAGTGNSTHLAGELFNSMADVKMLHVPFKGATPSEVALMGDQVGVMFSSIVTALPHAKNGRMKALAVTSAKRSSVAPELPTIAEAGLTGYDVTPWYGIFAPAGTPPAVVERMNKEVTEIFSAPDIQTKLTSLGADSAPMTQEEFSRFVLAEQNKWAKVIKDSGVSVD